MIGSGADEVVVVGLRATGEELARELQTRYGRSVEITVGVLPYPPSEDPQRGCLHLRDLGQLEPPLRASVAVDSTIVAGTYYRGTVRLTNTEVAPYELETSNGFSLYLFRPGDPVPVGVREGTTAGTGFSKRLEAGESIELPAGGGTASCDPALGYIVPAGTYDVRAQIHVRPPEGESADFWSEPATVDVLAR